MTHIVLAFEDNRLIGDLFGQFDQNLALIEQRLGVDAIARGNQVTLKGSQAGCAQERVDDGMGQHVGIGVAIEARLVVGELDSAQPQGAVRVDPGPPLFLCMYL